MKSFIHSLIHSFILQKILRVYVASSCSRDVVTTVEEIPALIKFTFQWGEKGTKQKKKGYRYISDRERPCANLDLPGNAA